jgi:hypothetical protein
VAREHAQHSPKYLLSFFISSRHHWQANKKFSREINGAASGLD